MAAYKGKKLAEMHGAERAARIKQLAANPATRKYVPTADLPTSLRQKRELNVRLNSPVVEGSSMTNRDVARQAKTAVQVKYGGQDAQLAGIARDTPSFYDQYLKDLANGSTTQQGIGTDAVNQLQGLQQGITGLSTASAGQLQGQANTDAAQRGATAGDMSGLASNATAVRQALVSALGAGEVGRSNANSTYANRLATVVGPGQKISATVGAAKNLATLRGEEGAYNQSVRDQIKGDEAKNVLAAQVAGVNTAKASADIAATNTRTQKTQADIDFFNKHGYYPPTGKPTTPKGPDTGKVNQYGYTDAQWRAMSVAQRQKIIKEFKGKGGSGDGSSPEWLTNEQMGAGLTQVVKLKSFATKAKTGQPFIPGHKPQGAMSRSEAAKKIYANAPSLKDPALLTAALDAVYDGHLSSATVQKLIDAGYKPARVAQALGVPTAGQTKSNIPSNKI